jgi:hypothetical protein
MELQNCLLLLYEVRQLTCSPGHVLALASQQCYGDVQQQQQQQQQQQVYWEAVVPSEMAMDTSHPGEVSEAWLGQAANHLGALLLLSAAGLDAHLELVQYQDSAAPTPTGDRAEKALPLGLKVSKEVTDMLQYCAPCPATALLLLSWSACLQLMKPLCSIGAPEAIEVLYRNSGLAGGIAAAAQQLAAHCALSNAPFGQLYRTVALRALACCCTVYDLSASRVTPEIHAGVVALLQGTMQGGFVPLYF